MKKETRQQVYEKYDGKCAYTGVQLGLDWQIDHVTSKLKHKIHNTSDVADDIENLLPSLWIVNHYKRAFDLEGFRERMNGFHIRLAKLPKKTNSPSTQKRMQYMRWIANVFDISIDKPFDGLFYFEKLNNNDNKI